MVRSQLFQFLPAAASPADRAGNVVLLVIVLVVGLGGAFIFLWLMEEHGSKIWGALYVIGGALILFGYIAQGVGAIVGIGVLMLIGAFFLMLAFD